MEIGIGCESDPRHSDPRHSNLSAFFTHINLHNKIIPRRTTHININADIDEIMKVDDDGRFILGTKELQR
jgi:hypothetical protein